MIRWRTSRKALGPLLLIALAAWGVSPVAPSVAQDAVVQFRGQVSWIAAETLIVSTDDARSVRVDLSQVDQDEYQRLASGDSVIVTGTISDERDRVVATSIESLAP